MNRIFQNPGSVKLPCRGQAEQHDEYGQDHKGIEECPTCHNVFYKKHWVATLADVKEEVTETVPKLCPACTMVKDHTFEGELIIEAVPERKKEELHGLIHNFGERATDIDPQDRIIALEETKGGYRVTTTENQLAERIAKKIKDAFNKVAVTISHSKEPYEVTRAHVTFTMDEE